MKGVSTVIVVIIFLMIAVALSGLTYMFFTGMLSTVSSSSEQEVGKATTAGQASLMIESFTGNNIYVRNLGTASLSNINVYVGDVPVPFSIDQQTIPPGSVATITLNGNVPAGDIKITSGEGAVSVQSDFPGYTAILNYQNPQTNTTLAGKPCNFTLDWSDITGLSGYIFSTNNSGAWQC